MTTDTPLSELLAKHFSSITLEDLPSAVINKAKELIADTTGAGVAGSASREVSPILDIMADAGGRKEASIWGHSIRLPANSAALVNGAFIHAIEMDDTHRKTYLHAGATVLPTVMAIGELTQASGKEVLFATVAGYETAVRIALSVSPEHRLGGYHPTATVGVFGSAMAASLLLHLSPAQMVNAVGLAGTQAAGLFQFLYDGASAKRLHPGRSAQSGIMAALLASRGFTGSPKILEGAYGFGRVMSDRFNPDTVTSGLGEIWHTLEIGIKPYSACRFCHAPIDAALRIRSMDAFTPSAVIGVEIIGSRQLSDQTGDQAPKTVMAAQLSTPFMVALALSTGGTMPEDIAAGLENRRVKELASRVAVVIDPDLPRTSREITMMVRFASGTKEKVHILLPPGEPETPLSPETFNTKFFALTEPVLEKTGARKLLSLISRIETLEKITSLTQALSCRH